MKLYIRIAVTAYLLLLLLAGTGHLEMWGIYHLLTFPNWFAYGAVLMGLFVLWLPASIWIGAIELIPRLKLKRSEKIAGTVILANIIVLVFFLARSENLLLGDGYKRIQMMPHTIKFWPTEYVDLMAHKLMYILTGSPEWSYIIIAIAAGIAFLVITVMFIRALKGDRTTAVASGLIIIGLAQIQFFFGYVESYAIMTVLATLFLMYGYIYTTHRTRLGLALLFFALAGIFHLSAWFFLPGMLYLLWLHGGRTGNSTYRIAAGLVALIALVLAVVYYTQFEGERVFLPIFQTADNPYSLLSLNHLTDIVNELLLASPLPLLIVIGMAASIGIREFARSHATIFMTLCVLGGLFLLVAVDPILGAVRDWDLLSLYGLPLAFLSVVLIHSKVPDKSNRVVVAAAAMAILIAHTVPWIGSNTDRIAAKDLMKKAIANDLHYTPSYYDGYLLKQWGFYVGDEFCDYEEMRRAAKLRVGADPDDPGALIMYALGCYYALDHEELERTLDKLEEVRVIVPEQWARLLRMRLHLGDVEKLKKSVLRAKSRLPKDPDVQAFEWIVHSIENAPAELSKAYDRALRENPGDIAILDNYAAIMIILGRLDRAEELVNRALQKPNLTKAEAAEVAVIRHRMDKARSVE